MKQRNRKKAYRCAHYHEEDIWLTNDPYDIYDHYEWCGVKRFGFDTDESPNVNDPIWKSCHPCDNCNKFKLCKRTILEAHNIKKQNKENEKYCEKIRRKYSHMHLKELEQLLNENKCNDINEKYCVESILNDYKKPIKDIDDFIFKKI